MPKAFPTLEEVDIAADGSPRLGRSLKQNELIEILQSLYVVDVTLQDADSNEVTLKVLALNDSAVALEGGGGGGTVKTLTICENGSQVSVNFLTQP